MEHSTIIDDMIAYYRARAAEYDEWFYRRNRYDHGPEINQRWFNDVAQLEAAFATIEPVEDALELAAGTGIWTEKLVSIAQRLTVVEASPEMIEINRGKLPDAPVQYVQANIFDWEPDHAFDLVFFSFWLSHVPPETLDAFLATVRRATRSGGRLFIIDSRFEQTGAARNNPLFADEQTYQTRKLNDGNEFTIVKVYYETEQLKQALERAGFEAEVHITDRYFIYASAIAR